ncbi:MAG TPA: tRNA pseudouridine(38-40) synthase TruA [Verrucomicrobiae bacterium]|nr:tRNA pseudouridine(38-40) synthase TruA [Verrucomicrobiae bacterium]
MRNIRLVVEYDGTGYCGWQVQPNGTSIQELMEKGLEKLLGERVAVISSGRTDAGVHARGMVASFRTSKSLPLKAFADGLNVLLPPDISVLDAAEASEGFNPRTEATGKHYRYTILNAPRRSPLMRLYSWHIKPALDLARMREAAAHFVGEHDFAAFRGANCGARTTRRTVFKVEVEREGNLILMDVHGSGFLKNMVRIMVGTLVAAGLGKIGPDEVASIIDCRSRLHPGQTAPPQGLCLMEVFY